MKMNEMVELSIDEMEKVAGGHVPLYNDGIPYYDTRTRDDSHGDSLMKCRLNASTCLSASSVFSGSRSHRWMSAEMGAV